MVWGTSSGVASVAGAGGAAATVDEAVGAGRAGGVWCWLRAASWDIAAIRYWDISGDPG